MKPFKSRAVKKDLVMYDDSSLTLNLKWISNEEQQSFVKAKGLYQSDRRHVSDLTLQENSRQEDLVIHIDSLCRFT